MRLVSRAIAIVAFPGVQLLDVAGPLEVFELARRLSTEQGAPDPYRVEVLTAGGVAVASSSNLTITPHASLDRRRHDLDTVVVAGGNGTVDAITDGAITTWLRAVEPRCRRVASVCSGAFLLARAGLLDGRRATTHWSVCDELERGFPSVEVDSDAIHVRDGKIATSAGITAGMDLALALVEEDLGHDLALDVARWLVLFVRRPGGQSQFSTHLRAQAAEREPLRDLQTWILEHATDDLSITTLAARVHMSPRHFARVFRRETGVTPAVYVERTRVEVGRRLLEDTGLGLDDVAEAAGFGSVETLRRAFHRTLGVAPSDYRARFRHTA
jgi:transcriptional regulator GlxA family with amidase domain